jgi:UDP-N-acetylmuramate dehydrogenase
MVLIEEYVSLKKYHTFGIDVAARYFCEIKSLEALYSLLNLLKTDHHYQHLPVFILGAGSNVLFTEDFKGIVIQIGLKGIRIIDETKETITVEAAAGENWHQLVLWSLEQGYGGIENLSLIPGSVGAAPVQNIGAYGVEFSDCFLQLTAISLKTGGKAIFSKKDCEFGYRHSIFKTALKNQYIICDVHIQLSKNPKVNTHYPALRQYLAEQSVTQPTIHDISNAVISIRQKKLPDPAILGNAGSFFKNPELVLSEFTQLQQRASHVVHFPVDNNTVKVAAAWLIEHCGWRGKRIGDVGVHTEQSLVLVNYGQGTGQAIKALASDIQTSVFEKFGIRLTPEVCIL